MRRASLRAPSSLLQLVSRTIQRHDLLAGGETVLVAVSGGADSLCLLHLLAGLREQYSLTLFAGHINHLMRPEAEADAQYVTAVAASLAIPTEIIAVDVRALAAERKLSLEDAGRQARYEALAEMAGRVGATCIATGHTADDQVETILLNFLRGGGPEGLAGMPATRELPGGARIIRPIIDLTKAETEAYCQAHDLQPRLDSTNLELFARRNRLRHNLLPLLREEQPALDRLLLRQAEIFRAEDDFLRELTEIFLPAALLSASESEITLAVDKLVNLPLPLARRVVRECLRSLRLGRLPLSVEQVDRVLELARQGKTGKKLILGEGLEAAKEYEKLILSRTEPPVERAALTRRRQGYGWQGVEREIRLPLPGEATFEQRRFKAELLDRASIHDLRADAGGKIAFLDAARFAPGEAFTLRHPRPGDRFVPLGSAGSMKLQDFFTNLKVPRPRRAKTIVVCQGDRIVWLAGYRIDDRFKVHPETRTVLRLELSHS